MDIGSKDISAISSNSLVQYANIESDIDPKKMIKNFHFRVIVKHTKVDTLLIVDIKLN
jgi:hypothetical protein